ncbi:hypothetical protein FRACA_470041 [Frankia canadensis]|uniref:Cytochrome P450 n=1 Tax=Frankia canadensis TaxID=1836972 RepID=A0A2I2KXV2_9ACTN|nr:hypothetical protein [Frankia canadensis]SNQ50493.1 hypothetical protein FRACA_470041 [Frankia canadensis]SOU57783.1 hypothetical protein FRACA_470041 [Frankia canadensis]
MTTTSDAAADSPLRPEDFDHHAPEFARNSDAWRKVARGCPVAHSQRQGGFYVAARYADVDQVAHEDQAFSSVFDPARGLGGGH